MYEDYVKRADVHKAFQPKYAPAINKTFAAMIDSVPAADVVEVRHGRWIVKTVNTFEMAYGSTGYEPVYECSLCGGVEESYLRFDEPIMPDDADFPNYCPNCGAKMNGGQDE